MATNRSNALQLFVYISRTRARGTSPFLLRCELVFRFLWRELARGYSLYIPTHKHSNVPTLLSRFLSRVGE